MPSDRVVVIGAGIGGLVAALALASRGFAVTVIEAAEAAGGKMRRLPSAGGEVDAGPTVFTMRWVFERIFAEAGARLDDHLALTPLATLARHAWEDGATLDLFADRARSAEAISAFAGPEEGRRYLAFCRRARDIYDSLETSFMTRERPSPFGLVQQAGLGGLAGLWRTSPFATMWQALQRDFADPRLRQLFARYATYCGSSPYAAPATLMLVAHVEQEGVWSVEGGIAALARALAGLAGRHGATIRYGTPAAEILIEGGAARGVRLASGERLEAEAVVANCDVNALASGRLGLPASRMVSPVAPADRSLSAVTWTLAARTEGFPLLRHNVFFSRDYRAEFDAVFGAGRLPEEPTVYVCAQDRGDEGLDPAADPARERLLVLINAPPIGDRHPFAPSEIASCEDRTFTRLARMGLAIDDRSRARATTPADFERLFPATGGALYGRATHGAMASFARAGSRTRATGLYMTGGSVHPGPGVPMAALSGTIAARALVADLASMRRSRPAATIGGMSTR